MTDEARDRALEENRRRSEVLANSRPKIGAGPTPRRDEAPAGELGGAAGEDPCEEVAEPEPG